MRMRDCIVIGGGQAGLAAGVELARAGADALILDAEAATGDQWRRRWASLRLFTPARYDGLPGLPFPAAPGAFPSAAEVADYLVAYARHHALPVEHGTRATGVAPVDGGFAVSTGGGQLLARTVIVATGATSVPSIPALAAELDPATAQLHSNDYRSPAQLGDARRVLVVGFGASGAELAIELASAGHDVTIAGSPTPSVPDAVVRFGGALYWFVVTRVLTRATPPGRAVATRIEGSGAPLIRISPDDVRAAGVRHVPRVDAVVDGRPVAAGAQLDIDAVVWCTGFRGDLRWVDVPGLAIGDGGFPIDPDAVDGLGFLGLPFQQRLASHLLGGVGIDARRVVARLRPRWRSTAPAPAHG